jgi:hypothetical protein
MKIKELNKFKKQHSYTDADISLYTGISTQAVKMWKYRGRVPAYWTATLERMARDNDVKKHNKRKG